MHLKVINKQQYRTFAKQYSSMAVIIIITSVNCVK